MKAKILDINVYEALEKRLEIIFKEFDNIYVSFSGGKDSGVLLNLCIKYMKENGIKKKIGVFHQDFECQYTKTTEYVERQMLDYDDYITPYWVCLPMGSVTSTSSFEGVWYPWDETKKDLWVRNMPNNKYIINLENNKFDFYYDGISQEEIYENFGKWYHQKECGSKGKTIGLVGIRTDESLNRWRAIMSEKSKYKNYSWTTKKSDSVYVGYPIYDWSVSDIWTCNYMFDFDYNKIYDMFYYAGLTPEQMRVASPFGSSALASINLYRVIDNDVWSKLLGRVKGVNFSCIYSNTKAFAWRSAELPKGHTWQTFLEFLLGTLPERIRRNYSEKFAKSIDFWANKGGVVSDVTIEELSRIGISCSVLEKKSKYKTDKKTVVFKDYPDDIKSKDFQMLPSYKRMCICILKNDHMCKYMGFSQTKKEAEKRKMAIEKYKNI